MKKSYFLVFVLLFVSPVLFAQRTQYVNQVIALNGGRFESVPPFADFASAQTYNPVNHTVTLFDTIFTQSVQDVIINGHVAYAAAQDSVVMYDLDSYKRIAAVADSGLNKLCYYNGYLIVSKQYPISRFFVEVLDGDDLSLVARIDGISGECAGITFAGNKVYVAVNGGFMGTQGKLAVINPSGWTLINEINFGANAIGIGNLFTYGSYIFSVNKTPYGQPPTGSITRFNYATQAFNTNVIGVTVGDGFGINNHYLYLKLNEGMGSYDLDNQMIADTVIVPDPGSALGITIHAGAIDFINQWAYLTIGNFTNFAKGAVVSLTGDSISTFSTGLNAEAIAIDFRNPQGIPAEKKSQLTISPNPAEDHIHIKFEGAGVVHGIVIHDLTGNKVYEENVEKSSLTVDCSNFKPGIYFAVLVTSEGNKIQKFVRK